MKNYFTAEDDKLKWNEGEPVSLLDTVVCSVTKRHNVSFGGIEGDYIINTMQYSLMNKTNKTYKMVVNVNGFKGGKTILLVEPNQYIEINEGEL